MAMSYGTTSNSIYDDTTMKVEIDVVAANNHELSDPENTTAHEPNQTQQGSLSPFQLAQKREQQQQQRHRNEQKPKPKQLKLPHLGASRQYWRDIILGVNDGLVSTFLLVVGVIGGGVDRTSDVLLTAISGAIAGAISMCAGEYVATKSQNEVLQGEINLEREHIRIDQPSELEELDSLLLLIGIPPTSPTTTPREEPSEVMLREPTSSEDLHDQLLEYYRNNPEALLKIMKSLEFGIVDEEVRSPIAAGLVSCFLFLGGSIPSVIPFACTKNVHVGLIGATVCTTVTLLVVGAVKTWATRSQRRLAAAAENLIIAAVGGGLAYLVGMLFNHLVPSSES